MPYDIHGQYTNDVPKDTQGFVNVISVTGTDNPFDPLHQMTALKAAALINKQVG
jgi:hypothetical protein